MTRRVLKYPFPVTDILVVDAHPDDVIALVARQPDQALGAITIWIEQHDRLQPEVKTGWRRTFRVFGTGEPIPDGQWKHRGSVIAHPFVWHVYEGMASHVEPASRSMISEDLS